jgi:RimJ/RimL family protein N-acetyltransferase
MAKSTILRAERLELRPFSQEFLTERYVSWLNDKAVVRYSEQRHRSHTMESCRTYAQSFEQGPHFFWAIVADDIELGHIGNMTATVNRNNRVADLAIMIGEAKARGHGFGLEAWRRACQFLLTELGMRKVTAGAMAVNMPMLRVMELSGMIEEGRRKQQFLLDGKPVDLVMFARFSE